MYEKPTVKITDNFPEGIYMASGTKGCKSIYMNGEYLKGTWSPITDGYKVGRGCEGCPAQNGNTCRFQSSPQEMNWDGDFRPSWEVQGHLPDEKGY